MTKQDFWQLFKGALELATLNAERQLGRKVPRTYEVILHGAGYSGTLMKPEDTLDIIYLAEDLFYRIIDVSVVEVGKESSKVFMRVSDHTPGQWIQTWNNPPGSGPFKQLVAEEIKVTA